MKYLILIDHKNLSELDKNLLNYLIDKDKNSRISFKPFLESIDKNQIKSKLDSLRAKDNEGILAQIYEGRLVFLLDEKESLYNTTEVIKELSNKHPLIEIYPMAVERE